MTPPPCNCAHVETIVVWTRGAKEPKPQRHDRCAALRAKVERMEKRLRLILEEPENTMSNSKALREMVRQARLALEESK